VDIASAYGQHIKKRAQRIFELVNEVSGIYTPAYFHHLRVEIKKMNAVLKLVKTCSDEFPRKRVWRPYKLLGSSAGEVREIQLEEVALRRLKHDQFSRKYLSILRIQRLEKKKIFLQTKNQVKASLEKRDLKILPYSEDINKINCAEYFNTLMSGCIEKMDVEKLGKTSIHELRMLLKEFFYNIEIIKPEAKTTFKKINQLQDLIGKWHDYIVIIRHLDNFKRHNKLSLRQSEQSGTMRSVFATKASLLAGRINKEKNNALSELLQLNLH
jgi:CHAD domain-containing protein